MQGQSSAIDMASIEAFSVVFAAALVWLAALVQHLTNVMERDRLMSSATGPLRRRWTASSVGQRERSPTTSNRP